MVVGLVNSAKSDYFSTRVEHNIWLSGVISASPLSIKLQLKLLDVLVYKMYQYCLNSTLFFMYGGREHFSARQD